MANKRKPHDDLRRSAIAQAAQILEDEGVGAVTARRIASGVGCSVGTLYNLFGDLDGLIASVNLATLRRLRLVLAEAVSGAPEGLEARLIALGDAYLDFALSQPRRWETLFRFRPGDQVGSEALEETAQLFAVLEKEAGGLADREDLTALWAAVHGVVELAIYRHLTNTGSGAERRYIRLIISTALRGFAARPVPE